MELRHIRQFLVIAEERSVTRAAERLGIPQPHLSTQLRQLEKSVGASLFRRLAHGVALTPAGEAFLRVVQGLPQLADRGARAAQRVVRGETGTLILGYTASSIFNPAVTSTIARYKRACPDVDLRLEEANTTRLLVGLREGSVDAAFLRPGSAEDHGLTLTPMLDEPMVAVVRLDHRLAQTSAIRMGDLADDPLLLFPREIGPHLFDIVVTACRRAGFEPQLGQTTPQIASIVNLVAAGFGVAIVPASMNCLTTLGVIFKQIQDDKPIAPLAFARPEMDASPPALQLERLLQQT